jgi:hypothetical protein
MLYYPYNRIIDLVQVQPLKKIEGEDTHSFFSLLTLTFFRMEEIYFTIVLFSYGGKTDSIELQYNRSKADYSYSSFILHRTGRADSFG